MTFLPTDAWMKIFSFLEPSNVVRLGSTCHHLAKLSENELIWSDRLNHCSLFPSLFNAVENRLFDNSKLVIGDLKKTLLSLYRAKTFQSQISDPSQPESPGIQFQFSSLFGFRQVPVEPHADLQNIETQSPVDPQNIETQSPADPQVVDTQVPENKSPPFLTKLELLPICRSSVDYSSQDIVNTVSSEGGFWSATGSWDPNSIEYLIYQLPHRYTLVLGVQIHLYNPNGCSGILVSTGFSENNFSFHSVLYPIDISMSKIHMAVFPFLAIGNFMKITLTGPHHIDVGNSYMMAVHGVCAWGVSLKLELTPEQTERLTALLQDNDPGMNDIVGRYADHRNVDKLSNDVATYVTAMSDVRIHGVIPRWNIYVGERDTTENLDDSELEQVPFLGQENTWLFKEMAVRKTSLILYPFTELLTKSEFFSSLKYLQILDLSSNSGLAGKILPESLFSLISLKVLNLIDAKLDILPAGIGNLTNLVTLNLIGNQLGGIPPEIGKLRSLKELFIGEGVQHHKRQVQHTLGDLPPQLGDLVCLEQLWLASSGVTSVPPELGQLTHLKCLLLHDNDPGLELPETLNNLKELKYFTFFLGGSQRLRAYPATSPMPRRYLK